MKLICENCGSDKDVEDFGSHYTIRILCDKCADKPMIEMKANFAQYTISKEIENNLKR
jgi:hypothetical protein